MVAGDLISPALSPPACSALTTRSERWGQLTSGSPMSLITVHRINAPGLCPPWHSVGACTSGGLSLVRPDCLSRSLRFSVVAPALAASFPCRTLYRAVRLQAPPRLLVSQKTAASTPWPVPGLCPTIPASILICAPRSGRPPEPDRGARIGPATEKLALRICPISVHSPEDSTQ